MIEESKQVKPKVVGFIVAYKHANYLEKLYASLPQGVFDSVIITNDESGDRIEKIAEQLGIPCYSHERLGYGGNVKYGLKKALELGAEYMVEIHGDGQYDVNASVPALLKIKEGYDFVMGSRFFNWREPLRYNMPLSRFFANIGLSAMARFVLRSNLTEFHNGFRVYSRSMMEKIKLDSSSNNFLFGFEIIALAQFNGLKIAEAPVKCFYSKEHTSISIFQSTIYAFQMTWVLAKYVLAKLGLKVKPFS